MGMYILEETFSKVTCERNVLLGGRMSSRKKENVIDF